MGAGLPLKKSQYGLIFMNIVNIQDLQVSFSHHDGIIRAVRGVSFGMEAGQSLGIVGESGSGKSVSLMALLRLLSQRGAKIAATKLELFGKDMLSISKRDLLQLRGSSAAMIFQDATTSFDPLFTIGQQLAETITAHKKVSKREALKQARRLLERVEIKNAELVIRQYPYQLSGGMLQRAMIAMALSCEPSLLIADEPTTALDVTIQAQILQLIKDLQDDTGLSLIIITHDLGVVAETTDRVVVMYGGMVMETADTFSIFAQPRHPYTRALIDSVPGQTEGKQKLMAIPGSSPNALAPPPGCPFHPRCDLADAKCASDRPPIVASDDGRTAACWKVTDARCI